MGNQDSLGHELCTSGGSVRLFVSHCEYLVIRQGSKLNGVRKFKNPGLVSKLNPDSGGLMIRMSAGKLITATTRWLAHFLFPLVRQQEHLILSPPFLSRQVILSVRERKFLALTTKSYEDWATVFEIFGREEYLPSGLEITQQIKKSYEFMMASGLKPLILDLGANIGVSSLFFSSHFPMAETLSVEPQSDNFNLMVQNLVKLPQIQPLHAAVAAKDGTLQIFSGSGKGNNAFRTFSEGLSVPLESVPSLSPQTLLAKRADCSPFLVKIDIEGFESQLFGENFEWLDSFPVVLCEIHDWMLPGSASSNALLKALTRSKRDIVISGENLICISLPR